MPDYTSSYTSDGVATYPNHFVDPRNKGYEWVMAYAKAAYKDSKGYMSFNQLNTGTLKMAEIKLYTLAKQPVDKYKKMFSPGEPADGSWRAIDYTPPGFMCKFRDIIISKLLQKKFDIQAYAVDPIAQSEEDAYFNQMKVKVLMRQEAMKAGSPLADSPQLQPQPGEPEDMEQLMMKQQYGYKHEMAEEAEKAINLINQQNYSDEIRKRYITSLVDYGIAAVTQYIDENGMCKVRDVNMEYFGSSYFEKPDGSDMVHWFEIVPTFVADLAPYYTKEQLDDICKKAIRQNGNPSNYVAFNGFFNQSWNRFKVNVMKIKFLSWNETIYKEETDSRDNVRFGKSSYKNKQFLVNKEGKLEQSTDGDEYFDSIDETGTEGQPTPKYINSTRKVVYKASWIIDTNYMHDWGLKENQNRKLSSWWDTDLDIQLYAWNFNKMIFSGMTERLITLEDQACTTWFNLQNLSNKLIPYLINMEMNSIEGSFPFGKGGTKGKPSDVIDFIFSNFVVPYRASDLQSRNPNFKPVSIEATGQLQAFGQLYEKLERILEYMRQVSGLNEATDASTVNAKNLNSTNEAMVNSTNNALYLMSEADKYILLRTADAIVQKVQIAVQLGKVEGYAKALGDNAIKFFSINPAISLHELGIYIQEAPTSTQREALWQDLSLEQSQGLVTVGDKYLIMSCPNLKEAVEITDYKIQKRKEEQQQNALQQTQSQAQAQGQQAAQLEQLKQQSIQIQLQADLVRINAQMNWEYQIAAMAKGADVHAQTIQADARNVGHEIQGQAKIEAAKIAVGGQVVSKHMDATTHLIGKQIDAEAGKDIQKIANQKPRNTAKT